MQPLGLGRVRGGEARPSPSARAARRAVRGPTAASRRRRRRRAGGGARRARACRARAPLGRSPGRCGRSPTIPSVEPASSAKPGASPPLLVPAPSGARAACRARGAAGARTPASCRARARPSTRACSPRALVSTTSLSTSSGKSSGPTPAAVEWTQRRRVARCEVVGAQREPSTTSASRQQRVGLLAVAGEANATRGTRGEAGRPGSRAGSRRLLVADPLQHAQGVMAAHGATASAGARRAAGGWAEARSRRHRAPACLHAVRTDSLPRLGPGSTGRPEGGALPCMFARTKLPSLVPAAVAACLAAAAALAPVPIARAGAWSLAPGEYYDLLPPAASPPDSWHDADGGRLPLVGSGLSSSALADLAPPRWAGRRDARSASSLPYTGVTAPGRCPDGFDRTETGLGRPHRRPPREAAPEGQRARDAPGVEGPARLLERPRAPRRPGCRLTVTGALGDSTRPAGRSIPACSATARPTSSAP